MYPIKYVDPESFHFSLLTLYRYYVPNAMHSIDTSKEKPDKNCWPSEKKQEQKAGGCLTIASTHQDF
jgi:hypothetical protein